MKYLWLEHTMITGALQVGNTGHNWGDIRICRHGMLRGAYKLAKESPGLKRNHQWSIREMQTWELEVTNGIKIKCVVIWSSRQVKNIHALAHSLLSGMGKRMGRVKVRKIVRWDKGSLIGKAKAAHAIKVNNELILYFPSIHFSHLEFSV